MFDFGIYISVLTAIIIGYISLSIPLRKERNYLKINNPISNIAVKKKQKIINSNIKIINILFFLLSALISFLYFFYDIKHIYLDIIYPVFKKLDLSFLTDASFSIDNLILLYFSILTTIVVLYIIMYIIIRTILKKYCDHESYQQRITATKEDLVKDILDNMDDSNVS